MRAERSRNHRRLDEPTSTSPAWFSRLGRPFAASEHAAMAAMARGHSALAGAEMGGVGDWREAGEILRAAEWDSTWWDHEEEERARLWERATDRHAEDDLLARLTAVTRAMTDAVHRAAAAAARDRDVDPALVRAAAGAALMAAHQHALAELAGEGGVHFFRFKYALFASGRWPLGYHRGRYTVF